MPSLNRVSPQPAFEQPDLPAAPQRAKAVSSPAATSTRPPRGTIKDRFEQMLDMRKTLQPPAVKVDGWDEHTAMQICEGWRESLVETVSIPELSRLLALNFERAHVDEIPPERKGERLLPAGSSKADYYSPMVETFLRAIGTDDEDMARVLESFKRTGMGALHRQPALFASTANGILTAVQTGARLHPPTKLALSSIQFVLTAVGSALSFSAAKLRFRNSGTEEIMPLGRADAAPSAKVGPSLAGASWKLRAQLGKMNADVKEMEKALAALQRALDERSDAPTGSAAWRQAEQKLRTAGEDLGIAFASFCLRRELKAEYKAASESTKIEYRGNEINLGLGYLNGAVSLSATLMAIFAPSAAATFGMTTAAVALGALIYAGYQLSSGPSKDGEAKATRAIVALSKSMDLMGGNAPKQQKARAEAYRTYLAERRSRDPATKAGARSKLLQALDQIALGDSTQDDLRPLENWIAYADYRKERDEGLARIEADHRRTLGLARQGLEAARPQAAAPRGGAANAPEQAAPHALDLVTEALESERAERSRAAIQTLDAKFTRAHEAKFNTDTVAGAWKTPYRMRFDSMGRLLLGKVAASARALLKHQAGAAPASGTQAQLHATCLAGKRQNLKACLRDWINFETAQGRLKEAVALPAGDAAAVRHKLGSAARALAAIDDPDAQALFAGDSRAQVDATRLAKKLTAGEEERYTMTMGGAAALGSAVNTFGAAFSTGVNIKKDVLAGQGHPWHTHYGHQKDGQVITQGSAPFTPPYSAAERARFQKTEMAKLLGILKRKGEPLKLALDVPEAETFSAANPQLDFKTLDAALDKLVSELETRADIADEITLSVGGRKVTSGKLDSTTDYYAWRREQAPLRRRAAFRLGQARVVGKAAWHSVASPVVQAFAYIPLTRTRRADRHGGQKSFAVRDTLTALAGGGAADRTEPASGRSDEESLFEIALGRDAESERFEIDLQGELTKKLPNRW